MIKSERSFRSVLAGSIVSLLLSSALIAQVRPIYDRGAIGLIQILKRLNSSASVLMIGAHPDDEDTSLLAYLARGESARTAYLSLTRGDGGQNIIGPELGEALGLIRTEELLQARKLDGAEQYFTRAYDYGFSKTLAEAKQKWDEKVILCDAVRVIRHFRPVVVVSQFSGTTADGHGQHQFAGYISPIAVKAAADASQCEGSGPAWKVAKLYVRHRGAGEPKLRVNTGRYDSVLGRSYFEIAMEARSQHKSQEQGVLELRGAQYSSMNPAGDEPFASGMFEGLDVSIAGAAARLGIGGSADKEFLSDIEAASSAALRELSVLTPDTILQKLVSGYASANDGAKGTITPAAKAFFENKRSQFAEAILLAAGVQFDALADRETVARGESIIVGARAFTPNPVVKVKELVIKGPSEWVVTKTEAPKSSSAALVSREPGDFAAYYNITVPATWLPTQPYWLAEPRAGDMFRWDRYAVAHTFPFQPEELTLVAVIETGGTDISIERPVEYRFADDVRGEIRRRVDVVPAVSVEMDNSMLIIPFSTKPQSVRVSATVTNYSSKPVSGSVTLDIKADPDWGSSSAKPAFSLSRTGEKAVVPFDITIPAGTRAGTYRVLGIARVGDTSSSSIMRTVAYPHIRTHRYYSSAVIDARFVDLKIKPVRVGYVVGSGDRVPEAIRQMGFDLEVISENDLASGDLSRFGAIVVGIRAYQVRPDVVANNGRLLDFAREGGTLIVQYQLPSYAQQRLMPFPTQMGPRVSDETAPVTILVPDHTIFNSPNRITQADFEGWVQERNLYNFTGFGPEYTGLLEAHDPGEADNKGGLVIAPLGRGTYIYTGYSFFRQLPAGVGGAYRLFANILSNSARRGPQ